MSLSVAVPGATTGPAMKATRQEMEGLCHALHRLTHRCKMRASARQRLAFDMVVLCSGLRPAVMVDYAGPGSQLVQQLCQLLRLLAEECRLVKDLRLLHFEDCVYVIHVHNLWSYLEYTLRPGTLPEFVILTRSTPRIASSTEREHILSGCRELKTEIFKAIYLVADQVQDGNPACVPILREDTLLIDLQEKEFDVLLPTANGWLLAYPVVYTFSKEEAAEASRRLAMTDLRLFRVSLRSCLPALRTANGDNAIDLLRFSVPKELCVMEEEEPWVGKFLQLSMGSPDPELWIGLKVDIVVPQTNAVVL